MSSEFKLIKRSKTSGAHIYKEGQLIHKIYHRSDKGYHSSKRQLGEIFWLEYFREEPLAADLLKVKVPKRHIVLKHHGRSIGLHGNLANLKTQGIDPLDLLRFLNDVEDMLLGHNVNHGDITPENICYDPELNKFVLIDFAFAMKRDVFTGGRSEAWLSPLDSVAISMIRSQVYAQLAAQIKRGGVYSSLPFDDIGPIKCQGAPHGLIWAGVDGFMRSNGLTWRDTNVLDIGCGSGRFLFLVLTKGAGSVTAIEGDKASYDFLNAVLTGRRITTRQFQLRNEMITPDLEISGAYDFCFLLNILMWVAASQGRKFMEKLLSDIGKICPRLFVMSSRKDGPGMHQLKWLNSPQSEFNYYRSLGFKTTLLARIPIWKKHRNLYCLEWFGPGKVPT